MLLGGSRLDEIAARLGDNLAGDRKLHRALADVSLSPGPIAG